MWKLDPSIRFLNHGSFGACPEPVMRRQLELRDRLERHPMAFLTDELEPSLDAARARLAGFVGADAEGIAFVSNATTGVNTVLRSLRFAPGDELLLTDHEYNACTNAVRFVAERDGARVVVAKIPFPIEDPQQVVDAVLDAVTPKTRFALLDHVTSPTGLVLPVAEIARALESRGVQVMIDGAHAPGLLPLDIASVGASYYTGNCHKWMYTPKGSAFLYVRADRRESIRPLSISHGANSMRTDRSRFRLEFDWIGTVDPTPWLCIETAIDTIESAFDGGWSALSARNRALALAGRAQLCEALDVPPPAPESMIAALAAIPLSASDEPPSGHPFFPHALQQRLLNEHRIEVLVIPWPTWPHRVLRFCVAPYTTESDIDALQAALAAEGLARR